MNYKYLFSLAGLLFIAINVSFSQSILSLNVTPYQRHTELSWQRVNDVSYYTIHKSSDGNNFNQIKLLQENFYLDFTSLEVFDEGYYFVKAFNTSNTLLASSDTIYAKEIVMSDVDLMDMTQRYTFRYFWDFGHPTSGMARERNTSGDVVTTGGTGFGIMAMLVAVENGYITREQAVNRLVKITSFLQSADKFHGVFPHWMNGKNGDVYPFSQYDNGGDLVETAFLMQGLLTARAFFDGNTPLENDLRKIISKIWEAVEWDFYTKNNSGVLYWHWSPQHEWRINLQIRGNNETMIVYMLAIASPTHGISANYWNTGWASNGGFKNGGKYYGYTLPLGSAYGGPLFFTHYSFLGFDPRNKKDKYANYHTQNVNHSLIHWAYCTVNPLKHKEYSSECWGLTASDDPGGYKVHEPTVFNDNGTISPTAALSSMPYTPEQSIAALKYFYFKQGEKLLGQYGFYDAFNVSKNWYATSTLAIDQGPIICMIQNHRTELLWKNFMGIEEIKEALNKIGFVEDVVSNKDIESNFEVDVYPNPVSDKLYISTKADVDKIELVDYMGKILLTKKMLASSENIEVSSLPDGNYWLILKNEEKIIYVKQLAVN